MFTRGMVLSTCYKLVVEPCSPVQLRLAGRTSGSEGTSTRVPGLDQAHEMATFTIVLATLKVVVPRQSPEGLFSKRQEEASARQNAG